LGNRFGDGARMTRQFGLASLVVAEYVCTDWRELRRRCMLPRTPARTTVVGGVVEVGVVTTGVEMSEAQTVLCGAAISARTTLVGGVVEVVAGEVIFAISWDSLR